MELQKDQWLIDTYTFTCKGKKCEVFFVDTYESGELWKDIYIELNGVEVCIWQDGVPEELADGLYEIAHTREYTAEEIESLVVEFLECVKEI